MRVSPPENARNLSVSGSILSAMNHPSLVASGGLEVADRRRFLARIGFGAMCFAIPGAFAEELMRTPAQTEDHFIRTNFRSTPTTISW